MMMIIIIWPFRSQFGLKLMGGGEPSPLDPQLILHWVNYYLVDKCYKTNCIIQWIYSGLCGGWRYPPYLQFELT